MSTVVDITEDELDHCKQLGVKRHMAKHPSFRDKSVVPTKQLYTGESHVLGILGIKRSQALRLMSVSTKEEMRVTTLRRTDQRLR